MKIRSLSLGALGLFSLCVLAMIVLIETGERTTGTDHDAAYGHSHETAVASAVGSGGLTEPVSFPESAPKPAAVTPREEVHAATNDDVEEEHAKSWMAVRDLLLDRNFRKACADPGEADPATLRKLIARADEVIQAFVADESAARAEAGLFVRLPDYVQGTEFALPKSELFRTVLFSQSGEVRQVELTKAEYGDLYELSDGMHALEAAIESVSAK